MTIVTDIPREIESKEKRDALRKRSGLYTRVLDNIEKLREMSDWEVRVSCLHRPDIEEMDLVDDVISYLNHKSWDFSQTSICYTLAFKSLEDFKEAVRRRGVREQDYNDVVTGREPFCIGSTNPRSYKTHWFEWREFYLDREAWKNLREEMRYYDKGRAGLKIRRPVFRKTKKGVCIDLWKLPAKNLM